MGVLLPGVGAGAYVLGSACRVHALPPGPVTAPACRSSESARGCGEGAPRMFPGRSTPEAAHPATQCFPSVSPLLFPATCPRVVGTPGQGPPLLWGRTRRRVEMRVVSPALGHLTPILAARPSKEVPSPRAGLPDPCPAPRAPPSSTLPRRARPATSHSSRAGARHLCSQTTSPSEHPSPCPASSGAPLPLPPPATKPPSLPGSDQPQALSPAPHPDLSF